MRVALVDNCNWQTAVPAARAAGADIICLPHFSFTPYVPATLDRGGFELAERAPARSLRDATELAGGAWLCASAYESEGEGVFYVTASLGQLDHAPMRHRQRVVEAVPGRYEQMFFTPGHGEPAATLELPWGPTGTLVGAEVTDARAWAALAQAGAGFILGGVSESVDRWTHTVRVVTGFAAAHGLTTFIANRTGTEHGTPFAGGGIALASDGTTLTIEDGLVEAP